MATNVTFLYNPGATVWYANAKEGVKEAAVKSVNIEVSVSVSVPQINYIIQFKREVVGTKNVIESTLFGDIDSALAEYKFLIAS